MTGSIDTVVVIIPAHNEQNRIAAAMSTVDVATRRTSLAVLGIVVLDSCTDHTREVVRCQSAHDTSVEWRTVITTRGRASTTRDDGLRFAITQFDSASLSRVAVLSTDADTTVPPEWICDHVRHLDNGDDAVAGVVELEPNETDDISDALWHKEYTSLFRADGSHPHVHCANLAVRLDVLWAVGGFGTRRRAEDIDLWARLVEHGGVALRSDQSSVVTTSRRLDGRVEGGFATALQQFRRGPSNNFADVAI